MLGWSSLCKTSSSRARRVQAQFTVARMDTTNPDPYHYKHYCDHEPPMAHISTFFYCERRRRLRSVLGALTIGMNQFQAFTILERPEERLTTVPTSTERRSCAFAYLKMSGFELSALAGNAQVSCALFGYGPKVCKTSKEVNWHDETCYEG